MISIKTKYKDMVAWDGLMVNNILDIGKIIKCMENKVDLNGLMEEYISVIM